jgi:hypothetical protein
MSSIRLLMITASVSVGMQTGAQAQDVCGIISRYFTNVPSAFISDRGQKMRSGWRSNMRLPNGSCYIDEDEHHRHETSCVMNNGASLDVIVNFGKTAEKDIDECLHHLPMGAGYTKRTRDSNKNGDISHIITWTNNAPDSEYEIYLSGDRDEDGSLSNYIAVSWRAK